ncbi:carboxymuconolactone decarboxylase family protein [Bizionia myxarmorum]|uniref:Carboxymuconolactone decarboxylase family protein n=1 Tax=Bizionia myxarmorum TaxID=291186 RepID=A0A5D0RD89_9FLAO|nr:carboxymuconolactone decarboxylase family protein [Bizionia myxarmorum]TYB79482.1 carboxymuconolactone decarboxylase family protein [Bizionia myxarmorum]
MKTDLQIPESISSRTEFKNKFSLKEMYRATVYMPRAIIKMVENSKSQLINTDFTKRLQLAVTEVNGCAVCSYGHAKLALRQGMSGNEISSFLSGEDDFIKPVEAKAIMFAQHYAESRGYPKKFTYDAIVTEYGKRQALIILAIIQVMTIGNMFGIPFSAFQSRLHGKPYKDSSILAELGLLIVGIFLIPIAVVHGLIRGLIGLPNVRLDKSITEEQDDF